MIDPSSSSSYLAYVGPDQMLPVASAFAAAIGVLLMFWRFVVNMITKPFKQIFRRSGEGSASAEAGANEPAADVHNPQNS